MYRPPLGLLSLVVVLVLVEMSVAKLMGGVVPMTQEEILTKEFGDLVQHTTQFYNSQSNKTHWHSPVQIADATKQVVQGFQYKYKLHLRATDCKTQDVLLKMARQSDMCRLKTDSPLVICSASVWHRPWLEDTPKISEIEECWEVTELDLLLTEIKHVPRKETSQTARLVQDIEKAINKLNLQGVYTNVYKYVEFTQDPTTVIHVVLNETACLTTDDPAALEQLKSSSCYDELGENTIKCIISPTKKHHLLNCRPVPKGSLRYMWRLANDLTDENQTQSDYGGWIRQPFSFEAQLYIQSKTAGFENTEKFKTMVRQSTESYNRRINSPFMHRALSSILLFKEKSPIDRTKLQIEFAATTCRKSDKYMSNFNQFLKECLVLETSHPIQNCIIWVAANEVHLDQCVPKTSENNTTSLGQKEFISKFDPKEAVFQELLHNVSKQFTEQIKPGKHLSVLHVSIVESTPGYIKMVVWFGECESTDVLPCDKDENPSEEMDKEYVQCDVEHRKERSDDEAAQTNISNCWHVKNLTSFESVTAKWNKLSPANVKSPEISAIIDQAVRDYRVHSGRSDYERDYVTNIFLMDANGEKELHFVLHLKKKTHSERSQSDTHRIGHQQHRKQSHSGPPKAHHQNQKNLHQCNVIVKVGSKDNGTVFFNCKPKERLQNMRVGAPRLMTQDERESSEFDRMLLHANRFYNQKMKPEYAHRLHGYKDAQVQVVAGTMTLFKAYYVKTACKRIADGEYFRIENRLACGSENMTHVTVCQVTVWRQSWLEKFEKYNFLGCQTLPRNTTLLNDVHVVSSEMHLRPASRGIVTKAVMLLNANLNNFTNYFKVEQVTTFEEKEDEGVNSFVFKMFLRPTAYKKGEHDRLFHENQFQLNSSGNSSDLLICKVKYTVDQTKHEDIEMMIPSCVFIQRLDNQEIMPRHNASLMEINNPEFQQNIQLVTHLVNKAFGSSFMYGRPQIENAIVEDTVGESVDFRLHLFPDPCMSTVMTAERCKTLTSSVAVTCNVRVWQQPWNMDHRLIHVGRCVRYQKPSAEIADKESETHEDVKKRVVPSLVDLFNNAINDSTRYDKVVVNNVTQETIAGRRFNMELFLKANHSNCGDTFHTVAEKEWCMQLEPFFQCQAVVWLRPWLNTSELLQLSHCKRIQYRPVNKKAGENQPPVSTRRLKQMMEKAVETYNQHVASDYIYGSPEGENVEEEIAFGTKTKFNLRMKPSACKLLDTRNTNCEVEKYMASIACQVIFHEKPWSVISQVVSLQNCRKVYSDRSATGTTTLTPEEQNSAQFQRTLAMLVNMYRPSVPIVYSLKHIENATVTNADTRNITFSMVLQPTGCNSSLPNADDSSCLQWQDQTPVQCEAMISDDSQGLRRFYLMNCQQRWLTEAKRQLTEKEMESSWFTKSVENSLAMHRKIFNPKKYYKAAGIEDAYIEREQEEIVNYKVKLAETDCLLPEDEKDIPYLFLTDCDVTSKSEYICKVVHKKKPDGATNQAITCATANNANMLD